MTIADIIRKINALIHRGIQTGKQNNDAYPNAQVNFNNQNQNVRQLNPYGFYSATPVNAEWIILNASGRADDKWGIGNVFKGRYDKAKNINGLEEGESLMLNVKMGSYILLKKDGTIEIDSQNEINVTSLAKVTVIAPDLEITSNVKITGDFEVIGDIDSTGLVKNNTVNIGSTHIHAGVTPGAGVTAVPQ